jgi:hypothetical protein
MSTCGGEQARNVKIVGAPHPVRVVSLEHQMRITLQAAVTLSDWNRSWEENLRPI